MRVTVIAVGRFGAGHVEERRLFERYAGRLPFPLDLREIEIKTRLPLEKRRARECERLLGAVPAGAVVVALDERGRALTTHDLATRLEAWRDEGRGVAFLIGGADGLDMAARNRADLVLSLGAATWPHLLVRALVAEQVYRAHCILTGHPYHRGYPDSG